MAFKKGLFLIKNKNKNAIVWIVLLNLKLAFFLTLYVFGSYNNTGIDGKAIHRQATGYEQENNSSDSVDFQLKLVLTRTTKDEKVAALAYEKS